MITWENSNELVIETTNPSKTANVELEFSKNYEGCRVHIEINIPSAFIEMRGALDVNEIKHFEEDWHAFELQTRNRISFKIRGSESIVETQFVSTMDTTAIVFKSETRTVEVLLSDEDANQISWFLRDFIKQWKNGGKEL